MTMVLSKGSSAGLSSSADSFASPKSISTGGFEATSEASDAFAGSPMGMGAEPSGAVFGAFSAEAGVDGMGAEPSGAVFGALLPELLAKPGIGAEPRGAVLGALSLFVVAPGMGAEPSGTVLGGLFDSLAELAMPGIGAEPRGAVLGGGV